MNASLIVEDVIENLQRRYGKPVQVGKSRLYRFGLALTCSINYSKMLRGNKFFFGLSQDVVSPGYAYPGTTLGDFVLLICGSADNILLIPRRVILEMLSGVSTRRLDIFVEGNAYILQTTGHPKLDATEYLNAFPTQKRVIEEASSGEEAASAPDRIHLRIQYALIQLGRAEGCSVWVPANDRNLSYRGKSLSG